MATKHLIDFTDDELKAAMRQQTNEYVLFTLNDYSNELFRRSQMSAARSMNTLTMIIAIATVVNVLLSSGKRLQSAKKPVDAREFTAPSTGLGPRESKAPRSRT
jgi:hypothetical protein